MNAYHWQEALVADVALAEFEKVLELPPACFIPRTHLSWAFLRPRAVAIVLYSVDNVANGAVLVFTGVGKPIEHTSDMVDDGYCSIVIDQCRFGILVATCIFDLVGGLGPLPHRILGLFRDPFHSGVVRNNCPLFRWWLPTETVQQTEVSVVTSFVKSEGLTTMFRMWAFAWRRKGSCAAVWAYLPVEILSPAQERRRVALRRDGVVSQSSWSGCQVQLVLFQTKEHACVEAAPSS